MSLTISPKEVMAHNPPVEAFGRWLSIIKDVPDSTTRYPVRGMVGRVGIDFTLFCLRVNPECREELAQLAQTAVELASGGLPAEKRAAAGIVYAAADALYQSDDRREHDEADNLFALGQELLDMAGSDGYKTSSEAYVSAIAAADLRHAVMRVLDRE